MESFHYETIKNQMNEIWSIIDLIGHSSQCKTLNEIKICNCAMYEACVRTLVVKGIEINLKIGIEF